MRAFMGGAFNRDILQKSDEELMELADKEIRSILNIKEKPALASLSRYPQGMPQYYVGHGALIHEIETALKSRPGLALTGSSYRGSGIPDCVHDAQTQAEALFQGLGG
jgi:oxygen-dependent protoporphyrinogen oxidase